MQAEIVEQEERLRDCAEEWQRLVDTMEDGVFLSWDWVEPWWRIYGGDGHSRLHTLIFRESDGAIAGIAPFYTTSSPERAGSRAGRLPGRTLRFLGSGGDTSPDYLNVLARPGREAEIAALVADHLAERSSWDALLLTDMAADAPMTRALEGAVRERFRWMAPASLMGQATCPFVTLAASPEEHLAAMPGKLRYNIRSRRKKLISEHGARFFLWEQPAAQGIQRLAELHRKRFDAKGRPHGFASAQYVSFHQEVAERFQRRGQLRLYCLEADGVVVAMLYCFRSGERVYHFQSGFDPDWRSAGVGQVLVASALEHAIGEGVRRFDFLKGEYAYKDDWATGRRQTTLLTAGKLAPRGLLHLYDTVLRPALGQLARRARS
jgi:CelD/BcsL family acetyltransferase involved in cellulose biosynthesis